MGLFDDDFIEQIETDYWIDTWEREAKEAEIRDELISGTYTKKELYERYGDLLENDYELRQAFAGELDLDAVWLEIQDDIDSGLYSKEEIMDKYDLTEEELENEFVLALLEEEERTFEEDSGRHDEIQEDINTGLYTADEILQNNSDLTEEELYRAFDTSMLLTEDYVDDYDPNNEKVCEDIQAVINSGFYTKSQILRMYRKLDEGALEKNFDLSNLKEDSFIAHEELSDDDKDNEKTEKISEQPSVEPAKEESAPKELTKEESLKTDSDKETPKNEKANNNDLLTKWKNKKELILPCVITGLVIIAVFLGWFWLSAASKPASEEKIIEKVDPYVEAAIKEVRRKGTLKDLSYEIRVNEISKKSFEKGTYAKLEIIYVSDEVAALSNRVLYNTMNETAESFKNEFFGPDELRLNIGNLTVVIVKKDYQYTEWRTSAGTEYLISYDGVWQGGKKIFDKHESDLNASWGGRVYSDESEKETQFQGQCMYPDCMNESLEGGRYCEEHTCARSDCYRRIMTDGAYPTLCDKHQPQTSNNSTNKTSSKNTICAEDGCYKKAVPGGEYCSQHTCIEDKCTKHRTAGSKYCSWHKYLHEYANRDPYDIDQYDDVDFFYDDWGDDFEDFDEAEQYWDEHHK